MKKQLSQSQLNRITALVNCAIDKTIKTISYALAFETSEAIKAGRIDQTLITELTNTLDEIKVVSYRDANIKYHVSEAGEKSLNEISNNAYFLGYKWAQDDIINNLLSGSIRHKNTNHVVDYTLREHDEFISNSLSGVTGWIDMKGNARRASLALRDSVDKIVWSLTKTAFLTGSYLEELSVDEDAVCGLCAIAARSIIDAYCPPVREKEDYSANAFVIEE